MINWLNSNQGFVMAVLTLVYVGTTAFMAWLMRRTNQLAARNMELVLELERRRSRPYVLFDIVAKDHIVRAVVRNAGRTVARNVTVTVTPALGRDGGAGERESPLTRQGIAYLAPGREFSDALDSGPSFFGKYAEARFDGSVSYQDSDGLLHTEPFHIDLGFQKDLLFVSEKNVGAEIEKLGKQLDRIASMLSARLEG